MSAQQANRILPDEEGLISPQANKLLRDMVKDALSQYFADLDGQAPHDLYMMVIQEVEIPLLETVLDHTGGNQTKAAEILGLNRGTLRKKLKQYQLG